ncbi:12000_t:CDS:2, partial [Racocetra persica]
RSGDGGIEICKIATTRLIIQCKILVRTDIGLPLVDELLGVLTRTQQPKDYRYYKNARLMARIAELEQIAKEKDELEIELESSRILHRISNTTTYTPLSFDQFS